MSENPYPNLGFNPVPGAPSDVTALHGQINSAAQAVKETNDLLRRLRNSNDDVWKGEGGDAFRAHFDATLAQDLGYAQDSLERAVGLLGQWHTGLVGFQDTAKGLETEAAAARGQHAQAVTALQRAQSNPDLGLANMRFSDPNELAAAQARLDAAAAQVRTASAAVDNLQGQIASIIQRARDLEGEHDKLAKKIAAELDAAAKDFAPSPPDKSIWDRIADAVKGVGKFLDEHRKGLHQILSIVAAVGGLVALVTPPPIDIIGFAVGAAATAGLLAIDLSDPNIREGLMNGELDAWKTVGLDSLGLAPAGGSAMAAGKVGWGLLRGTEAVADGAHAAQTVGAGERIGSAMYQALTHEPTLSSKGVSSVVNLLDKVPGVPNVATALGMDKAAVAVLQATGVTSGQYVAATATEGIDLFARSGKVVHSLMNPVESWVGGHEK
ncbi:hypothetical protein [Nocardia transvalensis]|uniref:hypothetical protein n=1 Tax=Nocardia transvalensis TaxID=37333 RepID=UPI001895355E|nr:hypothetical protein [Nocardia transvalensis]MBF6327446.1 hypothetical protein [Nocardia transvalensis]